MERRGLTELSAWLAGMLINAAVIVVCVYAGKDVTGLLVAQSGLTVAYGVRSIKGAVDRDHATKRNGKVEQ